jgi:hypothetical protein
MAIDISPLPAGSQVRRKEDGAVLVVVDNPRDGMWLHVRLAGDVSAEEELLFVDDVAAVLPATGTTPSG